MVHFLIKNHNLGHVWRALERKILVYFVSIKCTFLTFGISYGNLVYFMGIWYILWAFGIFYGQLVNFMGIWYILWAFGIFYGHLVI
jgi:hypothetical protein